MMDDNSNSRSSSDSVEIQIGVDSNNSPPFINGHMDTEQYNDEENGHFKLEIVEQPQQRGFRFRYECEGPSHGGLQGINSERFRKTVPTIKIRNYRSAARIVVHLVTDETVPKAHAHKLVGRNCSDGLCIMDVKPGTAQISFPNLCVQHVTRKKAADVLEQRICESMVLDKKVQLNDFNADIKISDEDRQKARQQAAKQAKNMQLNVVRLCFQCYLLDNQGNTSGMLPSVTSDPIYDSKAPGANALKICRMDKYSGCCTGNEEVFLLCEKVQKDDIEVKFVEQDEEGITRWESNGNFGPFDVHRQFAIVFKTPEYRDTNIDKPVNVLVMLQRKSDGESSDPKSFTYYPKSLDQEGIYRKRKKVLPYPGKGGFSSHIDQSGPYGGMGENSNGGGMSNNIGMQNGGSIPDLEQLHHMHQMQTGEKQVYMPSQSESRPRIRAVRTQPAAPTILHQRNNLVMNQPPANIIADPQQFLFEEVPSMSSINTASQFNGGNSPPYVNVDSPQNYAAGSPHGMNSMSVTSPYSNNGSVHVGSPNVNPSLVVDQAYSNGSLSPQHVTQTSPHTSIGSPHAMMDPSSQNRIFGSQTMIGGSPNPVNTAENASLTQTIISSSQATQMQTSIPVNMTDINNQQFSQPIQVTSSVPSDCLETSLETDYFQTNQQLYQQFNQPSVFMDNKMLHRFSAQDIEYELNPNAQEIHHQLNNWSQLYGGAQQCSFQARCATGGMYSPDFEDAVLGLDCVDGIPNKTASRPLGLDEVDSAITTRFDMTKLKTGLKESVSVKGDTVKTQAPVKVESMEKKTPAAKDLPYSRSPVVAKETVIVTTEAGVQAESAQQAHCEVQTDMDPTLHVAMKTSQALQYYAASGDIRALLMVQRYLMLVQDQDGDLPLHTSLINQKYEVFQNLLDVMATLPDSYSRINAYNYHHQTPLHLAVLTNQPLAVDLLVRAGGDSTLVDRNGCTPAHLAVLHSRDECLKNLLVYLRPGVTKEMPFPELNIRSYDGFTPVHLASQLENLAAMKLLVYAKANINMADGKSGRTALHHVVEADELSLAAYLILQAGANVNLKRFDGNTPLHIACGRANVGMVALLMAGGADPNIENDDVTELTDDSEEEESADGEPSKTGEEDGSESKISEEKQGENEERKQSDSEKDEDETEKEEERKVKSPQTRGLTPADFADNNEKILRVLNGEPYNSLSDTESEEEYAEHTTKKLFSFKFSSSRIESGVSSMSLHSTKGDLYKIDYPTRMSLSKLLDPCKKGCDWSALAEKLGLRKYMEGHLGDHSPTRLLLTYFEETGGTISRLCHALQELKRDDAVQLLNIFIEPCDRLTSQGTEKISHKDPRADSGMEDSFSKSPSPIRKIQNAN